MKSSDALKLQVAIVMIALDGGVLDVRFMHSIATINNFLPRFQLRRCQYECADGVGFDFFRLGLSPRPQALRDPMALRTVGQGRPCQVCIVGIPPGRYVGDESFICRRITIKTRDLEQRTSDESPALTRWSGCRPYPPERCLRTSIPF